MDEIKAQKKALKKAYKKAKRKTITLWKVLTILCAIVMVISVPLSVLAAKFDNTMAARFGGSTVCVGRGVVRGAHAAAADGGYCGCWR